jgi:heat shock protein HtpX
MAKGTDRIDFHDQISSNKTKSFFLALIVFVVIIALGYAISFAFSPEYFFSIMAIASLFSIFYVMITYFNSDKIALASVGARKADPVLHRGLYNAVESMSIASGLPMPQVYVMKGDSINAFATGRDPAHSSVCVTTGALEKLNKEELEGVIGHEMSHIANYDIRFITTVAVVVGAISIFSQMFLRSLWFRGGDDDRGGGNLIFFFIAIALAILAPIVVTLVQMAISRKREFMADAGSVQFTRYPPGLINSLKKIKKEQKGLDVPKTVAPLFFSNAAKAKVSGLFQTHPPIDERIKALEAM